MKVFIILIALISLMGCETVNLSETVAGGACGYVDYSITFMGSPMLGIKADRECTEDETDQVESL